jgi:hypothetical protein
MMTEYCTSKMLMDLKGRDAEPIKTAKRHFEQAGPVQKGKESGHGFYR